LDNDEQARQEARQARRDKQDNKRNTYIGCMAVVLIAGLAAALLSRCGVL
jgi:hypothetical protein